MSRSHHYLRDFIDTIERYPDAPAWAHKHHQLRYEELAKLIGYYCHLFRTAGVRPHQRALVLCDQPLAQLVLFYALSTLGAVVVLHAPIKSAEDWEFIESDIEAHHTFSQFNTETKRWGPNLYYSNHCLSTTEPLDIDGAKRSNQPLSHYLCQTIISSDCALILYTSGSTNRPKGIMLSHRNIHVARQSISEYLGLTHQDKICSALPFWFDYGLYQSILCFSIGAHIIQISNLIHGQQLIDTCAQHRITVLPITPHCIHLIKQTEVKTKQIPSVKTITSTGSPLLQTHIKKLQTWFPHASIFSMYGLTECKRAMYLPPHRLDKRGYYHRLPLGIAIPNTRIQLVDDNRQPVRTEITGEIMIQGEHIMMGYWNRKRSEQPVFTCPTSQQRCLMTGDLALMDRWGDLYYVGRKDEMFKCKGERVSPKTIEQFMMKFNEIDECVVFPDERQNGEVTIVVAYTGSHPLPDRMILACRSRLAGSHQPGQWIHLKKMPLLSSGKIDRRSVVRSSLETRMASAS